MKRLAIALAAIPLAIPARPALAQAPAAPEFIVNPTTLDVQSGPSIGMDARGDFVVVWNGQDGAQGGVLGQRFDAAGNRVGAEFIVNTTTAGVQGDSNVSVDRRGEFVVVWTDYQGGTEVKAQRFDRSGVRVGSEFRVNDYTTGSQRAASVALDAGGNFVVVWQGSDADTSGVFGRRFGATGNPIGADFAVNTYVTGAQGTARVVATTDGGLVVVFVGPDGSANGVHARRFDANGAPLGAEFPVTTALNTQFAASVAARPQGGFVVAWTSYGQDGSHNAIVGRLFDSNGAPLTAEILVNTYTTNAQSFPAVAADEQGNFVVIWESYLQDGSDDGVFGQRFTATGARRGGEFRVNTYTTGEQSDLALAVESAGTFVGVWRGQDGSGTGIIGQRFLGLLPASLNVDAASNQVLEPNETASFAPSWRNGTVGAQAFQGTLSDFAGPLPANYSIADANADYGSVPAGESRPCTAASNCYALSVTASARPAQHWDATVLETPSGTPNADGVQKRWVVHLGDSFSDMPRTSPFYRFVESVLHHGVTSGCGGTAYCPAGSTLRDQMAVFVLVAREGAGYRPPDCGAPVFSDVPASSAFCRYVEELARRGVVGGCAPGLYCPSNPVTREQMAVFVLRTLEPAFTPPACGTPLFDDVPADSPFCPWVEELARRGVVSGCGGRNFCPTLPVTREQTSVFIAVAFGLTLYGL